MLYRYVVFHRYALTNRSVAGYLASFANSALLHNLHGDADFRFVSKCRAKQLMNFESLTIFLAPTSDEMHS